MHRPPFNLSYKNSATEKVASFIVGYCLIIFLYSIALPFSSFIK
jgi:hypothetical protein